MNESQSNPYVIPLSILISGTLIAGAVMYVADTGFGRGATAQLGAAAGANNGAAPADTSAQLEAVRAIAASDHMLGDPSAPVKIIEYSDLECPFCSRFHETMKQIMDEFGKDGRVAWVYRHFPLEQIHPFARPGAMGAECANQLGGTQAFWGFVDAVFTRQEENLSNALFVDVAGEIGLDKNAFSSCISSDMYVGVIDADAENAVAAGGRGTPYSIIVAADGTKQTINGAEPYATVKAKIQQALGK